MSLSASEVGLVVAELSQSWSGAQVQKVHMRGPRTVLLSMRVPGMSGVLRISVEPGRAHLCVASERGPADPEASAFCMLMRKLMKGVRLSMLSQINDDRIVLLRTKRGALVGELFGADGRLVLCDDADRVLAVSPPTSRRAGLERGREYAPPPRGRDESAGAVRLEPGAANETVRARYDDHEASAGAAVDRARASKVLASRLKRQRRLVRNIEGDRARAGDAEELLRHGELLKANMGKLRRGMRSITVDDVLSADGRTSTVEIALEPSYSPAENLERTFAKARKAKRAISATAGRLADARAHLEHLEELRETLESADEATLGEVLRALDLDDREASETPRSKARKTPKTPRRTPYRTFLDGRGRKVLVGKSAADNDTLTVRVARPDDLWLHARGTVGSHVVIPLSKGEEVDSDRLVDAATLAAHFSEHRGNTLVEVTYTRRRYVQKHKGLPPGTVILLREKVLLLGLEPERLQRLLSTRIDG